MWLIPPPPSSSLFGPIRVFLLLFGFWGFFFYFNTRQIICFGALCGTQLNSVQFSSVQGVFLFFCTTNVRKKEGGGTFNFLPLSLSL